MWLAEKHTFQSLENGQPTVTQNYLPCAQYVNIKNKINCNHGMKRK